MKGNENISQGNDLINGLLKAYLLSAATDGDTIKNTVMDMTADIVFNSKAFYEPAGTREQEMLDRLSKRFESSSRSGKIIPGMLGIIIAGCMLFYYSSHRNAVVKSKDLLTRKKSAISSRSSADIIVKAKSRSIISSNKKLPDKEKMPLMDSASEAVKKDSLPGNNTAAKTIPKTDRHSGTPDNIEPGPLSAVYQYPEDYKTLWRPTPEKYELKTADFSLSSYHFVIKNKTVKHNYYLGMPFRKAPDDLIYINYGEQIVKAEKAEDKELRIPSGTRFYTDTQSTVIIHGFYKIPEVPDKVLSCMLDPFYFRRYEVTNAEYREFLKWVAENNGVTQYDQRHTAGLNIAKTFAYTFSDPGNPALKELNSKTINVFPDTMVFLKDFPFAKDDILPKTYFSNSEYDDDPVCGINYWQALAYLDWMSRRSQNYLDANKIPYKISFELPTDIEWEMASSLLAFNPKAPLIGSNAIIDNNWITSLVLTAKDSERNKSIDAILNHDVICEGNFVIDGFFYPGPADLRSRKLRLNAKDALHLDDFGISWMDDNVSEWMQEIYKDNWLPMYTKQRQALEQSGKEEDKISALVEDYFNKRNAVNGQLVRGGNFWDERFSDIEKKNLAGIMLKRFVSPDEAHATIGFRYVVRVEKK